jgi:hypothetical protein
MVDLYPKELKFGQWGRNKGDLIWVWILEFASDNTPNFHVME